jgi:hypothetical protein
MNSAIFVDSLLPELAIQMSIADASNFKHWKKDYIKAYFTDA